ncbi:P-loop containing nucleoside triphosphate hydrolase protein [Terfezia claveryi]|nr:P-loop containing nucleoside triphosphate hydrolase protein [Terfezia claveryi]
MADKAKLEAITQGRTGLTAKPSQTRFAMALLNKRDVTCVAATGFGKSLAFQMAAFLLGGCRFGIVITPIEALGEDQVARCAQIFLRATVLIEGDVDQNAKKIQEIRLGKYNLVYVSPEKLLDKDSSLQRLIFKGSEQFRSQIGFVVIDECHVVPQCKLIAHAVAGQLRSHLPGESHIRQNSNKDVQWDLDVRSVSEKAIAVYHATMSATSKRYVQQDWRSGQCRILVATSAWGMGINDRE